MEKNFLSPISFLTLVFCIVWHSNLAADEQTNEPLNEATPESQNLDSRLLNEAVTRIDNGDYGDIDALLIVRNNRLVLEKYFSPEYHGRDYRRPVLSTTKSFTSTLVGIAIDQGKIKSVQSNLLDLFPEYTEINNLDARKQEITLENLLTMSAGFQWNELETSYADPQNDFHRMVHSQDWVKYVLDAPMSDAPGDRLVYNSGCTLLLSSILQKTTGRTAEEFAIEYLFAPLGIEKYTWSIARGGITNTYSGLAMLRRDMAKLGILYLNNGRWLDQQVVPEKWVQLSTSKHVYTGQGGNDAVYGYGYQWVRFQDHDATVADLKINDVYFTWGFGGQFIFVIPHLNMVVVATGDLYLADERRFFDVLREHIFPAVLN
jgi:CubicO group peptidase (beta-lactamase class C family)